jgi:hypothetical protein
MINHKLLDLISYDNDFWQDSFYHNLTEEELARVHEYNFDHPGENIFGV